MEWKKSQVNAKDKRKSNEKEQHKMPSFLTPFLQIYGIKFAAHGICNLHM